MSSTFHFAVEVGDIEVARGFYVDILGCDEADHELPNWVDINLWGNELTLHSSSPDNTPKNECHNVDNMGTIPVPHSGVHLDRATYIDVKRRIEDAGIEYVCKPFIRFKDKELEQETFFIKDPHGNHLEIKSYADPDMEYPGWITPRGHPEWGCP